MNKFLDFLNTHIDTHLNEFSQNDEVQRHKKQIKDSLDDMTPESIALFGEYLYSRFFGDEIDPDIDGDKEPDEAEVDSAFYVDDDVLDSDDFTRDDVDVMIDNLGNDMTLLYNIVDLLKFDPDYDQDQDSDLIDVQEKVSGRMKRGNMNRKKRKFMTQSKSDLRKTKQERKKSARKNLSKRKNYYKANKVKIKKYQKSRNKAISGGKHQVKKRRQS